MSTLHTAVRAERAFLAELGGGCTLPVRGVRDRRRRLPCRIDALLAALDGSVVVRARATNADPVKAGIEVAEAIFERGGRELLAS